MRRLGLILVLAFLLSSLVVQQAKADNENDNAYQLEDVVITATKTPRTPGNITQKVEIISEEEIRNRVLGKGNIAEILSYEPGNFAGVLSGNDANWGSSGGLAQKYKSYLLDGLPVDSFVDPQSFDVLAFERIEDQRGPAAVLYPNYLFMDFAGNQSALSGTTNLILKEFIREPKSEVQAYYGSYNTYGTKFFHQDRVENLHLFLEAIMSLRIIPIMEPATPGSI